MQQCKLVEIAKAMDWKPTILVVDETTTALFQTGRELLYKLITNLPLSGCGKFTAPAFPALLAARTTSMCKCRRLY